MIVYHPWRACVLECGDEVPEVTAFGRTSISVVARGLAWFASFFLINGSLAGESVRLESPDKQLAVTFQAEGGEQGFGKLTYAISFHGQPLLDASGLRLELQGQPPLGTKVRIEKSEGSETDQTYRLLTGKTSSVRDHFKAMRLALREEGNGRALEIEARASNDAIAFRYVVPEQAGLGEFVLTKEATEFRLSKDATCYALVLPHFRSMYESEFLKLPASAFSNQGGVPSSVLLGLPLLAEVPGVGWLAVAEADLRDYASMYLANPSGSWAGHWFESRLAPRLDDTNIVVKGRLPHRSAWRVIMVADDPGRLIESPVLTSLNPETSLTDTAWIHAGKAAWDWWSGNIGPDGRSAYTTDTMKYYVDFAAVSGFEYMLIDAGWAAQGDITRMNGRVDIPSVAEYAAAKKVRVWIWLGFRETRRQMDEAFALYEKWGVAGVKIDFIERDDQEGMAFYYRAAQTAAAHHLMVDFHGCTKPSGLDRTFPNVMGYEAVTGMEQSKAGTRDNPDNHVMLPFTRMLVGRMDYTPGGFDNVTRAQFVPRSQNPMVMGTRAHQLAMYVVYEAPFQMVSDKPSAYQGAAGFQFIKDVPATWDETRVINGVPGEYITITRRRGREWYLGSMTNWQARRLKIPLSFLGREHYRAEIYSDAPDSDRSPKKLASRAKTLTGSSVLEVELAPGGGCAVRFVPRTR